MLKQLQDADIHLLRVFAAVVECGGLAAAQDRLNVASSTISTQIANLETRIGFRLCKRGRGGFQVTPEGRVVLEAAYKLFSGLGDFVATIEKMRGQSSGKLRIVLLDNAVGNPGFRLGGALALARAQQPYLRFEVAQLSPDALETAIANGEADIGISFLSGNPAGLDCRDLFFERQIVLCGRDHPLFEVPAAEVDRAMLNAYDWVKDTYRLPADYPFANPVISSAAVSQVEGVLHFLLAGTHIGFLPRHLAENWIAAGLLRPLLEDSCYYDLPFKVIARRDRANEHFISFFRDLLIAEHRGSGG